MLAELSSRPRRVTKSPKRVTKSPRRVTKSPKRVTKRRGFRASLFVSACSSHPTVSPAELYFLARLQAKMPPSRLMTSYPSFTNF